MKKQLWHAVIKIFPYRKYIKTAKNGAFYEYGANASEVVQKINTRTLLAELCQLTKTANFKVTPMKKHI